MKIVTLHAGAVPAAIGFMASSAAAWGNRVLWLRKPRQHVKEWHAGAALIAGAIGMIASTFVLLV